MSSRRAASRGRQTRWACPRPRWCARSRPSSAPSACACSTAPPAARRYRTKVASTSSAASVSSRKWLMPMPHSRHAAPTPRGGCASPPPSRTDACMWHRQSQTLPPRTRASRWTCCCSTGWWTLSRKASTRPCASAGCRNRRWWRCRSGRRGAWCARRPPTSSARGCRKRLRTSRSTASSSSPGCLQPMSGCSVQGARVARQWRRGARRQRRQKKQPRREERDRTRPSPCAWQCTRSCALTRSTPRSTPACAGWAARNSCATR